MGPSITVTGAHTPAAHDVAQTVPHRPQFRGSLASAASHPFAGLPSQSAKPVAHAPIAQRPPAQVAAAFVKAQRAPHAPQFVALVAVAVSHPFAAAPSQSLNPAVHANPHTPPVQVAVAFGAVAQTFPHAPQFARSVPGVTQRPAQAVVGLAHTSVHTPAMHDSPTPQARPHAPQLSESMRRSAHETPQRVSPPQSITHAPATQTWPAAHARPHAPQ